MFRFDTWREVFSVLSRNKLRSILTGLAVAWGMFVLVVLLGAGNGLHNKALSMFSDDAANSIWIWGRTTYKSHDGFARGRNVQLTLDDHEAIENKPYSEHVTSRFFAQGTQYARYGDRVSAYEVRAVHPDHQHLEMTIMEKGRFINQWDIDEKRKVVVVGGRPRKFLFKGADPVGKWLQINDSAYRVVGLFRDDGAESEESILYVPISTAQQMSLGTRDVRQVMFTIPPNESMDAYDIEKLIQKEMAERHDFAPDDVGALRIRNQQRRFETVNGVFSGIRLFIFLVGLGTIIAGIVGIGNIMLISVRERYAEFGLRKALGAKPLNIVGSVLAESMLLTLISGYGGMILGYLVLHLGSQLSGIQNHLKNIEVDIAVALSALGVLVFCGVLAGFMPAYRASKQNPIEALRAR